MTRTGEPGLLPVGETPVPRTDLQERLEGQQITRIELNPEPRPVGWSGLAIQIPTSAVVFLYATPAIQPGYQYVLAWRWLTAQRIIHRSLERVLRFGVVTPDDEEPGVTEWKRRIVGQVIRGITHAREPNRWGGDGATFEFTDGSGLRLDCRPGARSGPRAGLIADLDVEWFGPERDHIAFGRSVA